MATRATSVCALAALCLSAGAAAADITPGLYAVDNIGHDLLYISPADGQSHRIGDTGLTGTIGLAFNPVSKVMYLAGWVSGGEPTLYTIDTETAATTEVGPLGITRSLRGLAFDGAGGLRAIQNTGNGGGQAGDVYSIDPQTGAASLVANTGIDSIVYDAAYDVYRQRIWLTYATSGDVYSIDPTDGQPARFEFNSRIGSFGMEALAVTGGGEMLGVLLETGTDGLYGINKANGDAFFRGDTGFDQIVAMTFAVPAPGTLGLCALAGCFARVRRR